MRNYIHNLLALLEANVKTEIYQVQHLIPTQPMRIINKLYVICLQRSNKTEIYHVQHLVPTQLASFRAWEQGYNTAYAHNSQTLHMFTEMQNIIMVFTDVILLCLCGAMACKSIVKV